MVLWAICVVAIIWQLYCLRLLYNCMEEVGLDTVIKFLREKQKLIINSQYRYDMRHVVMSLNNACIDHIKQEFQCNDNRLDLNKFLWLMRQALDEIDQESHLICYQLVKLFQEIDIDSSSTIEWAQFLEYLSQSNWLSTPTKQVNFNSRDSSLLFHAFHEEAKYRKHPLKKVIELSRHNSLALLANNHSLSFLSYERTERHGQAMEEETQKAAFTLNHIDSSRVLSIDYSDEERLFGILLTNRNLCFVEDGEMQKNHGVIRSSGNEVEIRYLPLHRLWVLESVNSTLQVFSSPKSALLASRIVFRPHEEPITGIREVGSPLTLCTASLDGILKLWQISSGRLIIELDVRKERNEQQRKGVKGIATYNRGAMTYICTWMFTTEIFLWLPSLSLSKPFAGELHGHLGLVIDCAFAWRGELISVDDKRSVRVWNPQKLQCFQCFTIGEENCSLLVLRAQPYLITYSRLLNFYRIRTNSKADLQSEVGSAGKDGKNVLSLGEGQSNRVISLEFSKYYCFLIIVTSQQIKIMDINNIQLVVSLRPPSSSEYVSATLKSDRRICVATSEGMVQEYKIEDGQVVRSLDVCLSIEEQELKFIYYHEETKILLAVVECSNLSKLVTFDMLNVEDSQRIKEIQFQQINLNEFKCFQSTNRFFILSADHLITVWDYDKLIILNKIDLHVAVRQILLRSVSFIAESINQCLIVQSGKGVAILHISPSGFVSHVNILEFNHEQAECSPIVTASLLLQKIPMSYLQEQKAKKTKREMQFEGKKKVDFQMFAQQEEKNVRLNETYEEIFILAVANKKGEIYYYKLDELLKSMNLEDVTPPLRGKMQRVKQHRKAHMKSFSWSGKTSMFNCLVHKFSEEYSFTSNIESSGVALDMFYFYTSDNLLYFFTPYAQLRAEWTLSLPRPKNWNICYNEIDEVLARLQKTQQALDHIYQLNNNRFKAEFLMTKYLCEEETAELKKIEDRGKNNAKSSAFFSHKHLDSKKSILSINDKISEQKNEFLVERSQTNLFKKKPENIFEKQLEQNEKRRMVHRNSKDLFQKVQKSLSYSKQNQAIIVRPDSTKQNVERAQKSNFAMQMDSMINSVLKQSDHLIENSSVKSLKKESSGRRSSFNNVPNVRTQTNPQMFRSRSSGMKTRIKSSLNELSKNFTAGKIEWQNFKKGFGDGLLVKRGRLKL